MNHLGDTNKMVETPRTDDAYFRKSATMYDMAGEMKRMERELNAANDRIQSLIEERDRANRLAEWKWNLRDEFQLLLGTDKIEEGIEAVKELKRRIKRLEEALDTFTCVVELTPMKWNRALQEAFDMARAVFKAKEDKQ